MVSYYAALKMLKVKTLTQDIEVTIGKYIAVDIAGIALDDLEI